MKKILLIIVLIISGLWQLAAQTGFSGETGTITMDTKNPVVTLQSPNGGGSYNYLLPLNITWSATDDSFGATPISAGISTEEGGAINWLGFNLANSGATTLTPPQLATLFAKAHIKAVDAFGNEAVDGSDGYFELKQPGEITNVIASQRTDGSKLVDINYDLSGDQPQYGITLNVSLDNGVSYQPATKVSGNVGVAVPGDNLQIIWNAGEEFPDGIFNQNMKVKVMADNFEWECGLPFIDFRDGQKYETVQIGTQCWMADNLNIGIRINGSSYQTNNGTIQKYCYSNSEAQCDVYGGLYQWNEMMQYTTTPGVQGICPPGWQVPSDGQWTALSAYLGGESIAGGKMKTTGTIEAGTGLWYSPNTNATNSSGFSGLPAGIPISNLFVGLGSDTRFWSATLSISGSSWNRYLNYSNGTLLRGNSHQSNGFSVRCLKVN